MPLKRIKWILAGLFSLAVFTILAIRVAPGAFTAKGLPVGEEKPFGIPLMVKNTLENKTTFEITVLPSDKIRKNVVEGYEPLPNPEWFYLIGGNIIEIPAGETRGNEIAVKIPDNPAYYNQHYIVEVLVKPIRETTFQTNIRATYFLETEPKKDPKVPPAGEIALAPSIISFNESGKKKLKIYNNKDESIICSFHLKTPKDTTGLTYENTRDYSWLKNLDILKITEKSVEIPKRSSETVEIELLEKPSSKFKETILIVSQNEISRFARIQID